MIRILIAAVLPCLLSACVFSSAADLLVGQPAPVANYYLLNGQIESTAAYRGKVLVLAFWDASCRYCRREMPEVNQMAAAFGDRSDLGFVAININDNREFATVEQTIAEYDLGSLKQAFSGNGIHDEAFMAFKGDQVPLLVLIGKDGAVRWVGHSASSLKERLIEELQG